MKTHMMTGTRFHRIWKDMKTRCLNTRYRYYKDYGGRGITVCAEWHSFENFMADLYAKYKAHARRHGERDTFIERKDNDKGYELSNVTFVTRQQNNRNRRMQKLSHEKVLEIRKRYTYGQGKALAREYGVSPAVISEIVNEKRNYANH